MHMGLVNKVKSQLDLLIANISAAFHDEYEGDFDSLKFCVSSRVAFHNSDLTAEVRDIIETAFRERIILVLASTSTLAAGVNLPARRVILNSPFVGSEPMSTKYYRQMSGNYQKQQQDF